jgi:DNA polymerase-3 subunit epsilon
MANLLFIDIETTGLTENSAVIEIAIIPYIDGERKPHYQSYIRPHDGATLDPKAFEVNKIDIKKVWEFPDAKTVVKEILDFIDIHECWFTIAGHNAQFDIKGLYRLFCRNGEYGNYHNRFRPGNVCTFRLAKEIFENKRKKPEGFSLKKLCNFFEIELNNAHSALPDIQATIELYEKILPNLPTIQGEPNVKLPYMEARRKYMDIAYVQQNPDGDVWLSKEAMFNDVIRRFIFTELDYKYESTP